MSVEQEMEQAQASELQQQQQQQQQQQAEQEAEAEADAEEEEERRKLSHGESDQNGDVTSDDEKTVLLAHSQYGMQFKEHDEVTHLDLSVLESPSSVKRRRPLPVDPIAISPAPEDISGEKTPPPTSPAVSSPGSPEAVSPRLFKSSSTHSLASVLTSNTFYSIQSDNVSTVTDTRHTSEISQMGGKPMAKKMTLSQLVDLIEEIYVAKQKYDARCVKLHMPRESMRQYLMTFLNQKYGLKNLIAANFDSIMESLERYFTSSNEVAVFRKILCSELDEKFPRLQSQLKQQATDAVRSLTKRQHPHKSDSVISAQTQKKIKGSLQENEWNELLRVLYPVESERTQVHRAVQHYIKASAQATLNSLTSTLASISRSHSVAASVTKRLAEMEATSIKYSEFIKIVLDFQLTAYEQSLHKYVNAFRTVDRAENGLLSQVQFSNMVCLLYPQFSSSLDESGASSLLGRMVQMVDQFGYNKITFSECVEFFSSPNFASLL
eukprot:TRINITY_DN3746_c0_g2_i1.p1 TRINITY_DN3746_c0_g2~~TRINITY_DN3746_c0_g2_i1.p1  ORF type:complete len:514 (-),score=169.63 TRINITY_DN3746_c0_g2_i1:31-1512(-)